MCVHPHRESLKLLQVPQETETNMRATTTAQSATLYPGRAVNTWLPLLFVGILSFVLPFSVLAQASPTGSLTGTVVDQAGAVVPGVEVAIMNTGTGLSRTVTT